ncbi:MAG: DUF885 domain-containing protein [Candidatus Zixiibacteriota bacterium]|nr:MAG: DUF885 domain-containing protein [candidate division Zixibacteria bacterium]
MKHLVMALLFLVPAMSTVLGQQTAAIDSMRVETLFDGYLRDYLKLNPEDASQMGLPRNSGYEYDRGGLNDGSEVGISLNMQLAQKYLQELEAIDIGKVSKSQIVDLKILIWLLKLQSEGEMFIDDRYTIDHLTGPQAQLLNLMTTYHDIEDLQGAKDYIRRLDRFPLRMRQATQRVEAQEKRGIRPPVYIVDRVISGLDGFVKGNPNESLLYTDFKDKLARVGAIDTATASRLRRVVEETIRQKVYPAFTEFAVACKVSRQKADSTVGVWRLPDGDKYYQYGLKSYTTSSLPAQQVFDLGRQEVKRLQDQGRILLDSIGIEGDTTFGVLMQEYWSLQEKPELLDKFRYPDGPASNQMILSDYRAIVDKTWARLPELFAYIPKTKVGVEPVPAYKQASGLTYYESASLDGKRKGTFYINMIYPPAKPGMGSLTYHETIPGHHFQFATQQELTQSRLFKNLFFFSGFAEGWAMYVEDLAAEQGWLPDIYSRLAEINSQLFRAVRIVLDAGIHQQRWTREQALAYMADNLGWNSENEIDRYSVWPGQACAYTMGKLRIMAMRENAKKLLGSKFDLKAFHMAVLQNGSVPLDLLEEIVDGYAKGEM